MAAVQGDANAAARAAKKRGLASEDGASRVSRDENIPTKKKKANSSSSSPPPAKKRAAAPPNNSPQKIGNPTAPVNWNPKDLEELITNLGDQLPKVDIGKYSTQMEKINWNSVRFGEYSSVQCKEKWAQIITKIRRFRTLTELVLDAKEWVKHPWTTFSNPKSKNKHPDLPKKPLTPYFRYFLEKREKYSKENPDLTMTQLAKVLAKKYASLGEKKKQKYKESYERESDMYKVQMTKFRVDHPEMYSDEHRGLVNKQPGVKYSGPQKPHTPQQIFLAEKMTKHTNLDPAEKKEYEEKYRTQWKALPETKRVKWIRKALADEQRYAVEIAQFALENPTVKVDPIKSVLSKIEKDIKERIEGKPEKPPNSGYSLYSKIMLKQLKDIPSKEKMAEISKRWKMMNDKEKKSYTREALDATERYNMDYANYVAKLPEDERKKLEEEKVKGKKKAPITGRRGDEMTADGNSKPKKPMSALFCYQQENLANYKKTYPDKSEQDLTRTMARDYGELSDKKKNYYKQMAELARNSSEVLKENTNKKGIKLFKGEPKKPPQSGYLMFTMDAIAKLDIEPKERMQEIAKRWRELKPSEKEKYKKMSAEQMKKYEKDLANFEASLTEADRKLYQQFKGSGKKVPPSNLKRIKVVATENDEDNDDSDDDDESERDEEGDNDSSNDSDSSDDDSSDDESDKSESGSGSDSKSDSDSSDSDSDNTKNESSASSSEESDSDDSASDSDSGSDSDK